MWLVATAIFLGTSINFLEPISIQSDFQQSSINKNLTTNNLEIFSAAKYLGTDKISANSIKLAVNNSSTEKYLIVNNSDLKQNNLTSGDLHNSQDYDSQARATNFKPGVASWKTNTRLGSLKFDGNFDDQAIFKKGKALWQANTAIGSVDLAINLDGKINLTKSTAAWNTKTKIGSVAVKGNFNQQTQFSGGNAAWNAKTKIGSVAVKGNFDRQVTFTGGDVKIATKTAVGFLSANVQLDEQTRFKSGKASWDTNLPLSSTIGISGSFDDNTTFTGGSIKVGAKTGLGLLGVKANVNRETTFTGGSAFWKTKTKLGSIGLNADLAKDGNFKSSVGLEILF